MPSFDQVVHRIRSGYREVGENEVLYRNWNEWKRTAESSIEGRFPVPVTSCRRECTLLG